MPSHHNLNTHRDHSGGDRKEPFLLTSIQEGAVADVTKNLRALEGFAKSLISELDLRFRVTETLNRRRDTLPQRALRLIGIAPSGPALFQVRQGGGLLTEQFKEVAAAHERFLQSRERVESAFRNGGPSGNSQSAEYGRNFLQASDKKAHVVLVLLSEVQKVSHSLALASDQNTMRHLRGQFNDVVSKYRKNIR